MDATALLTALARAADPGVVGCAVLKPDRAAEEGWHVVERPDGVRVRLDTADGAPPNDAAIAAVTGADLVALALAPARTEKLAALALWRDQWTQPVTYGGQTYTLRANPDAQANFTRYVVALTQQIAAGVTLPTDTLPLQDAIGAVHLLAVSDLLAAMAIYSRAVMLRELQWNATVGQVEAARTAEELDAVTWG